MEMGHKAEFGAYNGNKNNYFSCVSRANTCASQLFFSEIQIFLEIVYFSFLPVNFLVFLKKYFLRC